MCNSGYILQLLNVYCKKYETGGRFWPSVHNTLIFSLFLMQAIAFGIFTVKQLRLAYLLTIPLMFATYLFNEYCRKRFLPIFTAYSAEVFSFFFLSVFNFHVLCLF